jgi:hypothetical protein
VGISKNATYENPYTVKGGIKHTGLEQTPKSIKKTDRVIGTWKVTDVDGIALR